MRSPTLLLPVSTVLTYAAAYALVMSSLSSGSPAFQSHWLTSLLSFAPPPWNCVPPSAPMSARMPVNDSALPPPPYRVLQSSPAALPSSAFLSSSNRPTSWTASSMRPVSSLSSPQPASAREMVSPRIQGGTRRSFDLAHIMGCAEFSSFMDIPLLHGDLSGRVVPCRIFPPYGWDIEIPLGWRAHARRQARCDQAIHGPG